MELEKILERFGLERDQPRTTFECYTVKADRKAKQNGKPKRQRKNE
jgi:hypothetical protein